MVHVILAALVAAASSSPSPSPTPSPPPTLSPGFTEGSVTYDPVVTMLVAKTSNVNAIGNLANAGGPDQPSRLNVSNALATIAKTTGVLRYGATLGEYAFPTVGVSGNATQQSGANTDLYGPLPSAYLEYAPSANFNIMAGRLFALVGPENAFTYQNVNIQRGLAWNAEPVVSRGVRATVTSGKFTGVLGLNDGFYSGTLNAVEAQLAETANDTVSWSISALVPSANARPNPTAAIANRWEINPALTLTLKRASVVPYLLYVGSPSSTALGYARNERATYAGVLVSHALANGWSLGWRIEYAKNASSTSDTSANADLVGYGPGSNARTFTLTPAYKKNAFFARAEVSTAAVSSFTPGLAFGNAGAQSSQTRVLFETGIQY